MMKRIFLSMLAVCLLAASAGAAEIYETLAKQYSASYPLDAFIIGVGAVQSSGDAYKDRRRAEILARLELAKVIKIATKGKSVDIMCEGKGTVVYDNQTECRNQLVQIVEETVDEVLEGSKIVGAGEEKVRDGNMYYAVAVLPRKDAVRRAEEGSKEAVEKAQEHIEKAKAAPDDTVREEEKQKAKEGLRKSIAYDSEKNAIEHVRQNSDDMFKAVAGEIVKIKEGR